MKALSRVLLFSIITSLLVIPYFNCGAPSDKGLFGSGGTAECIDPTRPDLCYGDPASLFLVASSMPISGYQISGSNGRYSFPVPCSDGGFPKVMVVYKVYNQNSGGLLDSRQAECIPSSGGVGNAQVIGQLSAVDVSNWGGQNYQFIFQIFAYAGRDSQFPIDFEKPYAGLQPIPRPVIKGP